MKDKFIYVIIVICILIAGIQMYLSHLPSDSDLTFSGKEYFGKDRFVVKMRSDSVIAIFNTWDTNYFKYCEYKNDKLFVSYSSDFAPNILFGSERILIDTSLFKNDLLQSKFIFYGNEDTIYMPARVITEYITYINKNSIH